MARLGGTPSMKTAMVTAVLAALIGFSSERLELKKVRVRKKT